MKSVLYFNGTTYVGKGGSYNTIFENAINSGGYYNICTIDITLSDDTVYNLTEADIMQGSLHIQASMGTDEIQMGGIVAKTADFKLNNLSGRWDNIDFTDAKIFIRCGLIPAGAAATNRYLVNMGAFYVDEYDKPDDIINIKCIDGTQFLDEIIDEAACNGQTVRSIFEAITKTKYANISEDNNFRSSAAQRTYRNYLRALLLPICGYSYISDTTRTGSGVTIDDQTIMVKSYIDDLNRTTSGYTIGPNLRYSVKNKKSSVIYGYYANCNTNTSIKGLINHTATTDTNNRNILIGEEKTLTSEGLYRSVYLSNDTVPITLTPAQVVFVGNPRLDIGDIITLTGTRDGDIKMPIYNFNFNFGGTETINLEPCSELYSMNDIYQSSATRETNTQMTRTTDSEELLEILKNNPSSGNISKRISSSYNNTYTTIESLYYKFFEDSNTISFYVKATVLDNNNSRKYSNVTRLNFDLNMATITKSSNTYYKASFQSLSGAYYGNTLKYFYNTPGITTTNDVLYMFVSSTINVELMQSGGVWKVYIAYPNISSWNPYTDATRAQKQAIQNNADRIDF